MVIINIGMPRSGTLWRYKLIRDLIIASGGKDGVQIRKQYLLHPFIGSLNADINTLSAKRLLPALLPSVFGEFYALNTHSKPSDFAYRMLQRGTIKAIYGYRDPRDCILSMLEYSRRAYPDYSAIFLELKTVEQATNFFKAYLDIWEQWLQTPNCLVIQYETFLEKFDTSVDKIVDHMELEIEPHKLLEIKNRFLPKQKPKTKNSTHFVHGVPQRHKTEFTPEELAYLNEQLKPYLEKMGYEL